LNILFVVEFERGRQQYQTCKDPVNVVDVVAHSQIGNTFHPLESPPDHLVGTSRVCTEWQIRLQQKDGSSVDPSMEIPLVCRKPHPSQQSVVISQIEENKLLRVLDRSSLHL
jgi:hypothetical protein